MYHGEKVAFGTITQLVLEDAPLDEISQVINWCVSIGLPVTLGQLGLKRQDDDKLMKAARAACAETETIHNMPFVVTPEAVRAALKAADAYGRFFLGEK